MLIFNVTFPLGVFVLLIVILLKSWSFILAVDSIINEALPWSSIFRVFSSKSFALKVAVLPSFTSIFSKFNKVIFDKSKFPFRDKVSIPDPASNTWRPFVELNSKVSAPEPVIIFSIFFKISVFDKSVTVWEFEFKTKVKSLFVVYSIVSIAAFPSIEIPSITLLIILSSSLEAI